MHVDKKLILLFSFLSLFTSLNIFLYLSTFLEIKTLHEQHLDNKFQREHLKTFASCLIYAWALPAQPSST